MGLSMTERMTRKNPNGRNYRVPLMCLENFELKRDKMNEGIFGDLADRLGIYEDCLTLEEAMEYAKKKQV